MKTSLAIGITLCLGTIAAASIHGPMYPPTNGVSFSYIGEADQYLGRTNFYAEMSMEGVGARWWGDNGGPIINSLRGSGADVVVLDKDASRLDEGSAIFSGTSPFTYLVGSGFVTSTVETRLTLRTTDMTGMPLPMIVGSAIGVAGEVVVRMDATDFRAFLLFEARNPLSGTWTPTRDLYNSFHTTGVGTLINFGGGFYESDPPPCPADFNQDGGIDGTDVEAFFAAWEYGDPSGDVNQDGGIDGSDVQYFFSVWEAGGC